MLIEYYATQHEDDKLFKMIDKFNIEILEAFNPEDYYYVIETNDNRILSLMLLLNIESYVTARGEKIVGASAEL